MSRSSVLSLVIIALLLLGGAIGVMVAWQTPTEPGGKSLIQEQRPDFRLAGLDGQWIEADDLDDKLTLLNFWATWCGPCRKEMPMLDELHQRYRSAGFQVVGVAMDDVQQVQRFYEQFDISYPTAVGASDVMDTIRDYGNAAGNLPYSVLINREGRIVWRKLGEVHEDELVGLLAEYLESS